MRKAFYKSRTPIEARFWSKVDFTGSPIGCWIWLSNKNARGYGQFFIEHPANYQLAHRFAFARMIGEIPQGLLVLHKCDQRSCVRPDHLFLGTARDNTQDSIKKGHFRYNTQNFTKHPGWSAFHDSERQRQRSLKRWEHVKEKLGQEL